MAFGNLPPLPNDPSQTVVDPIALGIAPELQQQDDQEPLSEIEILRQELAAERQRREETQRGMHDVSQQLAQNNAMMQQMMLNTSTSQVQDTSSGNQPSGSFSWEDYMNETNSNGGTVNNQGSQPNNGQPQQFVSVQEAARIADERIAATLQAVNQQQQVGANLLADFKQHHPDLHAYGGLVKEVYGAALQQPGVSPEQAYQYSLSRVRQLRDSGQIPAANTSQQPAPRQQPSAIGPHGILPNTPRGGQNHSNAWASPPAAQQTVRYDENFVANEVAAWQQERRDQQARKMAQ